MKISDRVERIAISPTVAVIMAAAQYKARGCDVVDFGAGEPDFPTPDHIKQAAVRALAENRTKYTPVGGIAPLREAVCAWHRRELGSAYQTDECIVTAGGKHALFNAVCSLINSGDEVIVSVPYWVSYPDIVKYAGGVFIPLATSADDGFCLRASAVEKLITPHTRMLIVNSPGNPTGAVIPRAEFERILEVCQRHNIWLLSDECYSHFVYGDTKPFSVASLPNAEAVAKNNVIVCGSLSKTFAMTGWRMGYALAPAPLVAAMLKLQSQSTSNPTSIAQYAALEALTGPMDSVGAMLREYDKRRNRILEGMRAIPGVTCATPQGAFYVFPDVRGALRHAGRCGGGSNSECDASAVAGDLLQEKYVAVVPGEAFGAPGHIRISYAASLDRIDEGVRRLSDFFTRAAGAS
jgi:aspartate aminotransferase